MSAESFRRIASKSGLDIGSIEFARLMDGNDILRDFRDEFVFPHSKNESSAIYLAANKRGLPAKEAKNLVTKVMESWRDIAVECHFTGILPAATCEEYIVDQMAQLVGAKDGEVAALNDVDTNIHLLLVSFYRPDESRHKFLIVEDSGFLNIAKSHIRKHGRNEEDSLLIVKPKPEKTLLESDDIIEIIESEGSGISTILLPGIVPNSADVLDIQKITKAGHDKGCMVGFCIGDLVGDVELKLHDWDVDFACWDTGKYLGAGPCAKGGAFMHWKHAECGYPSLSGWWSHPISSRFEMTNVMEKTPGISGYKISNAPPVKIAQLKAALDVYSKTNMKEVVEKSDLLTAYLKQLLPLFANESIETRNKVKIVPTSNSSKRGSLLNLRLTADAGQVCVKLLERGIVCSYIHPDILQVCLAPLLCHFEDVLRFARELIDVMSQIK